MLLDRIKSQLVNRSWLDFFLELVIVIGGVFVGIQASNWNDERLERQEGRLFAARLLADLRHDLESRTTLVRYYDAVVESASRTATRLDDKSIGDPAALVIDAYRATEYAHRPANRAAFDEIVSSGKLGLIPQSARQAGFVGYYRYDNSLAAREAIRTSPYRLRVRRQIPHDVQTAIRAKCSDLYDEAGEVVGFSASCDPGVAQERMEEAATLLLSDGELLLDLQLHSSTLLASTPAFSGEVSILEASVRALSAVE